MGLSIKKWISWALLVSGLVAGPLHGQATNRILEIDDPLTNKTTRGSRNGGIFTSTGWKTDITFDYIQYNIPTCTNGEVEFDVTGIYASKKVFPNIYYDKYGVVDSTQEDVHYAIFNMYDRDDDNSWYGVMQWHNPYKCIMHIYGYVPDDIYKWRRMKLRLNVAAFSGGYEDDPHAFEDPEVGPFDFSSATKVWHHRLLWGDGHMRWWVDGVLVKDWDYSSFGELYSPPDHSIRLGSGALSRSGGYKTPIGLTFSNFKFYRYVDNIPPNVIGIDPSASDNGVSVDSDIIIHFDEIMDAASTQAAVTITPSIAGAFKWVGKDLLYQRTALLQPSTTYTVQVATSAKDRAGNYLANAFISRFTTHGLAPSLVEKYGIFEIPIIASGFGNRNRYRDVSLLGTFKGPTKTITIEGFWDDGDVWKVRMSPTEVGHWTYTITSAEPQLQASGSFDCVTSKRHGFVRANPSRPYSFMYDDGTPWMWLGDTSWRGFTSQLAFEGRFKPYVDLRVGQGYTALQSIVHSYINGNPFWSNEGGQCFAGTDVVDYDRLNPQYFRWIDKRIEYANSAGMVPVIVFTWAQDYLSFSDRQFSTFCRYLVSRYAAYNVVWVLSGEYDEIVADGGRPTSEFEKWGSLVKQFDPYKHPISLHPTGRSTSAEFGNLSWFDFVMQQTPYTVRDMRRDRVFNKPVVNGEPRYFYPNEDNTPSRNALWECVTNGGYYTSGFYTTYAPDKGGYDTAALPEEQNWVKIINNWMTRIDWYKMDLHPEWISSGNLMAQPGKAYLAYNTLGGPVTLNLSGSLGSLPARWINPRDGSESALFTVQLGGSVLMMPPFSGDWALYIGEERINDIMPPLQPDNLTSENPTIKSLSLRWDQPLPAEDGDLPVKYLVFRGGVKIATIAETYYTDADLHEDTEYEYTVYSVDDVGNQSLTAATGAFRTSSDLDPPVLTRVHAAALDTLVAYFSEPVDSVTAVNRDHYQILQGVAVRAVQLLADKASVRLITENHALNRFYSLIARSIADRAIRKNLMGPNNVRAYKYGVDFTVRALTPSAYQWAYLQVGDSYYLDRTYTLSDLPVSYQNLLWLRTKNDDKQSTGNPFVTFTISAPATIYVAYDATITSPAAWLADWTKTGDQILTTDVKLLTIYKKSFAAGEVALGGNGGGSSNSMYVVLVKPDEMVLMGDQPRAPLLVKLISN